MSRITCSILGTVGVPGNYGGFETLADNLVRFHSERKLDGRLSVYCSSQAFETHPSHYLNAELRYINLNANGPQSIPYDILSLLSAVRRRDNVILLLGVSGALALPLIRLVSRARVLTNIDGIEWKREKWRGLARLILRWSERAAVRWSHAVIADNAAIADHVRDRYRSHCHVIAYGGDHAITEEPVPDSSFNLPGNYALSLCRIEPENNVAMILEAFAGMPEHNLVFVGNWDKSEYGRELRARYCEHQNIHLLDPVYDAGRLRWIRDGAMAYIHGHSAGGTNPSLVEMMHFGIPVFAHGCSFNRHTTEDQASFFESAEELRSEIKGMDDARAQDIGKSMREIAQRRYTWEHVGRAYFNLMEGELRTTG
ncbi:DUF1972 domain-containing protein [Marinobacter sp.]|uniref:DUF1972 domain-containing protein n=1 Tax=Marinobacter sp. TaxID=50741 RepID=UPI002B26FFE1|nr:DUF1972 domain-containing protein [Marinobacter sp.]